MLFQHLSNSKGVICAMSIVGRFLIAVYGQSVGAVSRSIGFVTTIQPRSSVQRRQGMMF